MRMPRPGVETPYNEKSVSSPPPSTTRFRDRAEVLDFLLEVSEVASSTLDLDELLRTIATIVRRVVPYELFSILLYSEKKRGLRVRFAIGHPHRITQELVIPLDQGLTGWAASTRQPVMVGDVRADPRYLPTLDAVRSELAVPMVARGRLVGVIDLQSTRLNAFTQEDADLVRLIASRVAVAIDNARLYRKILRHNQTLRILTDLAHTISSTLDLEDLLNRVAHTLRRLIQYDAFTLYLIDEANRLLRSCYTLRFDNQTSSDHIPLDYGACGAALASRRPVRVEDVRSDPRYASSFPACRSEIAVPLIASDRVLGVLNLQSQRLAYFSENHEQLLWLTAPLLANAVENARLYEEVTSRQRRLEENLKAARDLQSALLLREPPPLPGLQVSVRARPAQEISGDLYDFFEHPSGNVMIAFGDVSGKGAAAALYGALVSGLLRILAPRQDSPAQLMRSLNTALAERKVGTTYVTLLIMCWYPERRMFTLANAGVFPPIVCRKGQIVKHRVEGIPLGLLDDRHYDQITLAVEPGDVIFLYSDGILEQRDPQGQEYGRAKIYRLLERVWDLSAEQIVEAFFEEFDRFRQGAEIVDDQTVIVFKVQ